MSAAPTRRRAAALWAAVGLAAVVVVGGCSSAHPASGGGPAAGADSTPTDRIDGRQTDSSQTDGSQTYGTLPSWLPTAAVPVGRILDTSAQDPKLGIQGDTMRVRLPRATLLVTAVGPSVPEEGHFPIPATTRCEFSVTITGATGSVPIAAGQWSAVDERNVLHELRIAARPGRAVPRAAIPGAAVSFDLVGDLPPGSGALIWSPVHGATVGTWDFDVEID